jgi:hypothetical protein
VRALCIPAHCPPPTDQVKVKPWRDSLRSSRFGAVHPVTRLTVSVRHRNYHDCPFIDSVNERVGKAGEQTTPDAGFNFSRCEWIRINKAYPAIKLVKEISTDAFCLFVVPANGVVNFLLCRVEEPDIHCGLYFAITSS